MVDLWEEGDLWEKGDLWKGEDDLWAAGLC